MKWLFRSLPHLPFGCQNLLLLLFLNLFYFWWYHMVLGILVPWPGIKPVPSALEAQSLNQWITREVPDFIIIAVDLQNYLCDSKYFVSHSVAYFVLPYGCFNELEVAKLINLSFMMILLVSCYKVFSYPRSWIYSSILSSKSFRVLYFTFKSAIHLELFFLNGM